MLRVKLALTLRCILPYRSARIYAPFHKYETLLMLVCLAKGVSIRSVLICDQNNTESKAKNRTVTNHLIARLEFK